MNEDGGSVECGVRPEAEAGCWGSCNGNACGKARNDLCICMMAFIMFVHNRKFLSVREILNHCDTGVYVSHKLPS